MFDETKLELYKECASTIRVAGKTLPKGAGRCAFHYLQKGMLPIDFMCIGANANQQATKAMGIFCHMVKHSPEFNNIRVAFEPFPVRTLTGEADKQMKSATIWRTVIYEPTITQKVGEPDLRSQHDWEPGSPESMSAERSPGPLVSGQSPNKI
jgi:hypothetical protein